jgi:group II intron reverse transcriptase/maturase
MKEAKPCEIEKRLVCEAYKAVKSNRGSAGIDRTGMQAYDENKSKNLYKLWNRMSWGCYFPKAFKLVEIPKTNGGTRPLGIPTIEDRIAWMTVLMAITSRIDPLFHEDSYGYRPNKTAHEAVAIAKERCMKYPCVLDLDISRYFDTINHELFKKAVSKHVKDRYYCI